MIKQAGVSLSEVLISLFLSSLLITSIIQLYLNNKREYLITEERLATSFDLQWVSDLLSDSIRRAGFTPCLGIDSLNLRDKDGNRIHAIQTSNQPQPAIRVHRMHEHFVPILEVKNSIQITVPKSAAFHAKRPILIADCEQGEIQHIASMKSYSNETLITFDKPLQFHYAKTAYVGEFLDEYWFIKKNLHGQDSLHYQLVQAEEISDLIRTLKIKHQHIEGKSFLEIMMGLVDGNTHQIMVAVRGS